jgi:hypothetical protein
MNSFEQCVAAVLATRSSSPIYAASKSSQVEQGENDEGAAVVVEMVTSIVDPLELVKEEQRLEAVSPPISSKRVWTAHSKRRSSALAEAFLQKACTPHQGQQQLLHSAGERHLPTPSDNNINKDNGPRSPSMHSRLPTARTKKPRKKVKKLKATWPPTALENQRSKPPDIPRGYLSVKDRLKHAFSSPKQGRHEMKDLSQGPPLGLSISEKRKSFEKETSFRLGGVGYEQTENSSNLSSSTIRSWSAPPNLKPDSNARASLRIRYTGPMLPVLKQGRPWDVEIVDWSLPLFPNRNRFQESFSSSGTDVAPSMPRLSYDSDSKGNDETDTHTSSPKDSSKRTIKILARPNADVWITPLPGDPRKWRVKRVWGKLGNNSSGEDEEFLVGDDDLVKSLRLMFAVPDDEDFGTIPQFPGGQEGQQQKKNLILGGRNWQHKEASSQGQAMLPNRHWKIKRVWDVAGTIETMDEEQSFRHQDVFDGILDMAVECSVSSELTDIYYYSDAGFESDDEEYEIEVDDEDGRADLRRGRTPRGDFPDFEDNKPPFADDDEAKDGTRTLTRKGSLKSVDEIGESCEPNDGPMYDSQPVASADYSDSESDDASSTTGDSGSSSKSSSSRNDAPGFNRPDFFDSDSPGKYVKRSWKAKGAIDINDYAMDNQRNGSETQRLTPRTTVEVNDVSDSNEKQLEDPQCVAGRGCGHAPVTPGSSSRSNFRGFSCQDVEEQNKAEPPGFNRPDFFDSDSLGKYAKRSWKVKGVIDINVDAMDINQSNSSETQRVTPGTTVEVVDVSDSNEKQLEDPQCVAGRGSDSISEHAPVTPGSSFRSNCRGFSCQDVEEQNKADAPGFNRPDFFDSDSPGKYVKRSWKAKGVIDINVDAMDNQSNSSETQRLTPGTTVEVIDVSDSNEEQLEDPQYVAGCGSDSISEHAPVTPGSSFRSNFRGFSCQGVEEQNKADASVSPGFDFPTPDANDASDPKTIKSNANEGEFKLDNTEYSGDNAKVKSPYVLDSSPIFANPNIVHKVYEDGAFQLRDNLISGKGDLECCETNDGAIDDSQPVPSGGSSDSETEIAPVTPSSNSRSKFRGCSCPDVGEQNKTDGPIGESSGEHSDHGENGDAPVSPGFDSPTSVVIEASDHNKVQSTDSRLDNTESSGDNTKVKSQYSLDSNPTFSRHNIVSKAYTSENYRMGKWSSPFEAAPAKKKVTKKASPAKKSMV